jgi:hypothetical protein
MPSQEDVLSRGEQFSRSAGASAFAAVPNRLFQRLHAGTLYEHPSYSKFDPSFSRAAGLSVFLAMMVQYRDRSVAGSMKSSQHVYFRKRIVS